MKITITEQEGRVVAALCGDLDNASSSEAERSLAPLLEREDCDIAIDCEELDYISSSGLRLLLNLYKSSRKSGHKAILKNLNEDVADVFRIAGFLQLFEQE